MGLNLSLYDISAALASDNKGSADSSSASSPEVKGHAVYSEILKSTSASPRSAVVTSNEGIYVVRATGAFVPPSVLKAGSYLLVPSTYKQTKCKYALDVYVAPAVAGTNAFKFVKTT